MSGSGCPGWRVNGAREVRQNWISRRNRMFAALRDRTGIAAKQFDQNLFDQSDMVGHSNRLSEWYRYNLK